MPGYQTKQECVPIVGTADLNIRSLLDREQFSDPFGFAASLGISSATWPIFGLLWPSGAELAACMALRVLVRGERILEIGCGLGLSSLVMHRRGADITASDCHPLAGEFLAINLLLNRLLPMKYRHGEWAEASASAAEPERATVEGRFGLIIGSDVLYDRDASVKLAGFIARHAAATAEVCIVDPDRGNRAAFSRGMREQGFSLIECRLDHPENAHVAAYKGRLLSYRRSAFHGPRGESTPEKMKA
jgi:SAM-dependent methyltransferase